jgi:hypothetical protein
MKPVTRDAQLQELRNRIDKGLSEAERGESVDGEMFMQALLDDLDAREMMRKARQSLSTRES